MQIHDLNTGTPGVNDYVAMDTGSDTYKTKTGDIKPAYTSGDDASPSAWETVGVVTTGLSFYTLFQRITTMMKNVRYLYTILGSSTFSTVASTITGAIGNTALGTTATTLSGAIAEHESDISTLATTVQYGTAAQNVTGSLSYVKIGRIVVFSGTLALSASFAAGSTIISNIPSSTVTNALFYSNNNNAVNSRYALNVSGTNITAGEAIPSGVSLRVAGAYLSAS